MARRLLLGFLVVLPVLFAQQDRIAGIVDPRIPVLLKGNSNPRAQAEFDRGPVAPSQRLAGITLNFKPTASQQAALQELLRQQQDRTSAEYHHWLQPQEFADRFGLSSTDLAKVVAWAKSQGLGVEYQAQTRTWIRLSGSAAQVQSAFHTQLHRYEVNGEWHFANAADPGIPAALEPLISVIRGLDDFYPKPPHRILQPSPEYTMANGVHLLVPADLWTIYDVNPLLSVGYTGAGQSIVVVGQSNIAVSDIAYFRGGLGLPVNDPQVVLGGADPGTVAASQSEANLDLEWAGGMAPNASVIYVYTNDADDAAQYAIDKNLAPIISESFGECEALNVKVGALPAYYETLAQQANALGITWVASSGDQGAAGCDNSATATTAITGLAVDMPASVPEVTGVGGSTFNDSAGGYWSATNNSSDAGSALKYIPEGAWNDSSVEGRLAASGGGASTLYPKPSWQTGLGVPSDAARDVPDIAFAASPNHDGYIWVYQGAVQGLATGGTSASAPVFAGMLAILNQYLVANHSQAKAGLGNINPDLYRIAHSSTNAFHDITSGSNVVPCVNNTPNCTNDYLGYNAGPGYDEVTGLGSIDLANLASQWAAPTGAALTFTAAPSVVDQSAGGSSCPFAQFLTLQETNGYGVDLTSANFAPNGILSLFGSVRIAPLGSLSAAVCYPGTTPTSSSTLQMNGVDTLGNVVVATTPVTFQTSQQAGGTLAISPAPPNPLLLNMASASQSASGTIALTVGSAQQWTVSATPSGQDSAWLSISPHAGTGPAQITVTASGTGLSAGIYSAILIIQSQNTVPQYVTEGVIFTIGASPSMKITAVANAASFQQSAAPGMYLSVFGTALAPPNTALSSSTSPIPLSLAGVSATINGVAAAVEYASPGQVNLLIPFEIPAGPAVLGLNNNGQAASYVFTVSLAAPGIFVDSSGLLAGAESAAPGGEIAFYITGQGDVSPAIVSNTAAPSPAPAPLQAVSVTIGGMPAALDYAALAYGYEGLTQINVTLPKGLATGSQKVVVTIGGVASPAALINVN